MIAPYPGTGCVEYHTTSLRMITTQLQNTTFRSSPAKAISPAYGAAEFHNLGKRDLDEMKVWKR